MHRELLFTGTAPVCHLAFSCNVVSRNTTDTSAVVGAIVDDVFGNVTVATLVPSAGESAYGTSNPFDSFTEDVCSNLLTEFLQDDALNLEKHADLLAKLPPEDCIESVQWAYSKCYWCSPEASSNPQYCTTYDQKPCDVPLDERKTALIALGPESKILSRVVTNISRITGDECCDEAYIVSTEDFARFMLAILRRFAMG